MQSRFIIPRQSRVGVAQLNRIGDEIVIFLLAVRVLDVKPCSGSDRRIGRGIPAARTGQIGIDGIVQSG
jgi:hypothetical protein